MLLSAAIMCFQKFYGDSKSHGNAGLAHNKQKIMPAQRMNGGENSPGQ